MNHSTFKFQQTCGRAPIKAFLIALVGAAIPFFGHAEGLRLSSNALVGVDHSGKEIARLLFLEDGKITIQLTGQPTKTVEAKPIGEGQEGGMSWKLSEGIELEMHPGVGGYGNYRDRVNHFMLMMNNQAIELQPDVTIVK